MSFENQAIFGSTANPSVLPASSFRTDTGGYDWGAILGDGIAGRINQEIQKKIGGAVESGQLVVSSENPAYNGFRGIDSSQALVYVAIGVAVYLLAKS